MAKVADPRFVPASLLGASVLEVFLAYLCFTQQRLVYVIPGLILVQAALCTTAVAIAHVRRDVSLFGKSEHGSLSLSRQALLWPYAFAYRFVIYAHRVVRSHEPVATPIAPGYFLSGWMDSLDHVVKAGSGGTHIAILDLTCELPRRLYDPARVTYLCIPTWDKLSPSPADIQRAASWCTQQRKDGRDVVVHCAFGHGRSATCLAAALVLDGIASTPTQAVHMLQAVRPLVGLTEDQQNTLGRWWQRNGQREVQLQTQGAGLSRTKGSHSHHAQSHGLSATTVGSRARVPSVSGDHGEAAVGANDWRATGRGGQRVVGTVATGVATGSGDAGTGDVRASPSRQRWP